MTENVVVNVLVIKKQNSFSHSIGRADDSSAQFRLLSTNRYLQNVVLPAVHLAV